MINSNITSHYKIYLLKCSLLSNLSKNARVKPELDVICAVHTIKQNKQMFRDPGKNLMILIILMRMNVGIHEHVFFSKYYRIEMFIRNFLFLFNR